MNSRDSHLDIAVIWADDDLQELKVTAANERFGGQVSLYASPDELRDITERLHSFVTGRSERREFMLGQEDFAGYGTVRLNLLRQDLGDQFIVEVALRANPPERLAQAESCVVRLPASLAEVERFELELRRVAQRFGTRAGVRA